jgi:hypothetical protein
MVTINNLLVIFVGNSLVQAMGLVWFLMWIKTCLFPSFFLKLIVSY